MAQPAPDLEALSAPPRLVAETRELFRRDVLAFLDRLSSDGQRVARIDMGQTVEIDASGLGILVLVQKKAKERGLTPQLLQVREQVRRLLALTKLDYLFEFVD